MAGNDGGRPSVYPTLLYADARAAVRQLTQAFGFTELAVYEGEGRLGGPRRAEPQEQRRDHARLEGHRQPLRRGDEERRYDGVYVVVADVDAHHRRAVEHGAEILMRPRRTRTTARGTTWPGTWRATSGASGRTRRRSRVASGGSRQGRSARGRRCSGARGRAAGGGRRAASRVGARPRSVPGATHHVVVARAEASPGCGAGGRLGRWGSRAAGGEVPRPPAAGARAGVSCLRCGPGRPPCVPPWPGPGRGARRRGRPGPARCGGGRRPGPRPAGPGRWATPADSRCRTSSEASPWSATAAAVSTHSHVASWRVRTSWASSGSAPSCSASHSRAYGRSVGSSRTARTSGSAGGADDAQRLEGEAAQQGVLPRAPSSSSATALPTGRAASQARYSARGRRSGGAGRSRGARPPPTAHVAGGVSAATQICSSLTQTAQLPSGVSVAVRRRR